MHKDVFEMLAHHNGHYVAFRHCTFVVTITSSDSKNEDRKDLFKP